LFMGKSPCLMRKSPVLMVNQLFLWLCSIVLLNYQRVLYRVLLSPQWINDEINVSMSTTSEPQAATRHFANGPRTKVGLADFFQPIGTTKGTMRFAVNSSRDGSDLTLASSPWGLSWNTLNISLKCVWVFLVGTSKKMKLRLF
jgi:hypothetical protein